MVLAGGSVGIGRALWATGYIGLFDRSFLRNAGRYKGFKVKLGCMGLIDSGDASRVQRV